MESQIQQAVEIALSGTADPQLKSQAIDFCENIKSSPEGYESALKILELEDANEGLVFFIYQVVDGNIDRLSTEEVGKLYRQLCAHLGRCIDASKQQPVYLRNKLASLFGKLFVSLYLDAHPEFLSDLLSVYRTGSLAAVDYYTRVLIAMHYEIGDRYISRSREGQDRNNLLKDAIRSKDMDQLVESWREILGRADVYGDEIINNTLAIVGHYVTWMEITLFVSGDLVPTVFSFLQRQGSRNESCQCVIEIIGKKMKPINKLELLSMLDLATTLSTINVSDNDDVDFMENLAKLVNQMGLELVMVIEQAPSLLGDVQPHLFKVWPLVFHFLGHDYDDVTQQVFPFIQQYFVASKKIPQLVDDGLLSELLNKVILKMKYDDDDDGEDEDGFFKEIRTKLKSFQDSIATLRPELYVSAIPVVVTESMFSPDSAGDWRKFELGLFELGNYADSLRTSITQIPKADMPSSPPYLVFRDFLVRLIESDVMMQMTHPCIQLGFFELVVKHYSFLNTTSDQRALILRILTIFMSPLAVLNPHERVRLRCWYLLFRFLKVTKPRAIPSAFVQEMVVKMQSLLVIEAALPTKDGATEEITTNFSSQLYLFESVGLLSSLAEDAEAKMAVLNHVFAPLFSDLEKCVAQADDELAALQANHDILAIGTVARGFDDGTPSTDASGERPDRKHYQPRFSEAAEAVLITLERMSKHQVVRDAARFAFQRFIPILGPAIHVHLTKLVSLILAAPTLRTIELSDFLPFLGQLVHTYKGDGEIYQLLNSLLTPVMDKVFALVSADPEDEVIADNIRDKNTLKRSFVSFLANVSVNHASSLLVTETNKQRFPQVLQTLFDYSYDACNEPIVAKMAIGQLSNMVSLFGNPQGKLDDPEDRFSETLEPLAGIDEFLMERVTKLSFELPFSSGFDVSDAQHRIVSQEIAALLKAVTDKRGSDFVNYLSAYLSNMGLQQNFIDDLCLNLTKGDTKSFKKYFIRFIGELK
ncbi:exportin-T [Diutina catenulata]